MRYVVSKVKKSNYLSKINRSIKNRFDQIVSFSKNRANPNPVLNFSTYEGNALAEENQKQIQALVSPDEEGFNTSFKTLTLGLAGNGLKQVAFSPEGGKYYFGIINNSKVSISRKATPQKIEPTDKKTPLGSPHRLRFKKEDNDGVVRALPLVCDETSKRQTYKFTVTRVKIFARIGKPRPCSQKKLWNNISAFEYLKAIGLVLTDEQQKLKNKLGCRFHIPHREAFSLGGAQKRKNTNRAATAGSNWRTLYAVEQVIKKLLISGYKGYRVNKVVVEAEDIYVKDNDVLVAVTIYTLSWLYKGKQHSMQVPIDHLDDRLPSEIEHTAALEFGCLLEMNDEFPSYNEELPSLKC